MAQYTLKILPLKYFHKLLLNSMGTWEFLIIIVVNAWFKQNRKIIEPIAVQIIEIVMFN